MLVSLLKSQKNCIGFRGHFKGAIEVVQVSGFVGLCERERLGAVKG